MFQNVRKKEKNTFFYYYYSEPIPECLCLESIQNTLWSIEERIICEFREEKSCMEAVVLSAIRRHGIPWSKKMNRQEEGGKKYRKENVFRNIFPTIFRF